MEQFIKPTQCIEPRKRPYLKTIVRETKVPFHIGYSERPINTEISTITGSQYSGSANALGFAGKGTYTYSHGVIYEGEFRDGHFHGRGVLIYPQGQRVEGKWCQGKLVDDSGSSEFKSSHQLKFPNRLSRTEVDENGLVIATEDELEQPANVIPMSCYDTADGYFESKEQIGYGYDGEIQHLPSVNEQKLIKSKFRKNADHIIGYKPSLYEYWTSGRSSEIENIKKRVEAETRTR